MARKEKEFVGYSGGLETKMSVAGIFFLILGIIGLIISFIISGFVTKTSVYSDWGDDGLSAEWIGFGVVSLIQGIVLSVIFNAGGEIIRLLKKLNGLKFSGKISESTPVFLLKCSECGHVVDKYDKICPNCGKEFESLDFESLKKLEEKEV